MPANKLLNVQIVHDITPFRLVTSVSENVIILETWLNIDKFTLRNFPEILIFIFKLFIIYMLVMFLFFVLHWCNFYLLTISNYIKNDKLYFNCDCCFGDIDFHLYS